MNSTTLTAKRKQNIAFEEEPPEKKLVSDGDIFIKQMVKKQKCTVINLQEQLLLKNNFYPATDYISVTNYTNGSKSLQEFQTVSKYSDHVEELKSMKLSNEEVDFYLSYIKGEEHLRSRHKNMNEEILQERIANVLNKIKNHSIETEINKHKLGTSNCLDSEHALSSKPNSIATRLLKFALENHNKNVDKFEHPMDNIKNIELDLNDRLDFGCDPVNIKKIRKKARSLGNQITAMDVPVILPTPKKVKNTISLANHSKWDMTEIPKEHTKTKEPAKSYGCKDQNLYTIKNGNIVKLDSKTRLLPEPKPNVERTKLSIEEIRLISKFQNYDPGTPSNTLFVKNLARKVDEEELRNLFKEFNSAIKSIKVMQGRMKGQAFIEFSDEKYCAKALNEISGEILQNKVVILQFGKAGKKVKYNKSDYYR